ncbi:hypothetical protein RFI_34858 [Reticulomyxa filosa]|uniref:Uncharacterized protein n=1 Tax=Reticulomyxa filosa TaxID=46433 RepID=X6LP97_RETFI|nr:hypothetical protein RFI_34858 [Reticulomyxa filosa]|eukprot:ETO02560.1 hypothetical protein RFI_34858 [Reticulomyxa filosa]
MCQDQVQGPIDNSELVDAEDLFAIEERVRGLHTDQWNLLRTRKYRRQMDNHLFHQRTRQMEKFSTWRYFGRSKCGQKKWYESHIRVVAPEGSSNAGKAAVHFIGWAERWDEWIHIKTYSFEREIISAATGNDYLGESSWFREGYEKGKLKQKGVIGLCNFGEHLFYELHYSIPLFDSLFSK